ncbi:MAG TPA: ergothioneine biosynthesis protein EgtB [Acidimicrobiales bacterium]|jgi:ergothioneine biosynthesis protein EgtB|nr:ergothioneine biosynthesis protein EgtB [Acidimicrobiales bacterium]
MADDSSRTSPPDLVAAFASVRALTERLAAPLSAEDQTVQSMADVSPTKWHRAHVTWFFETFVLGPNLPDYQPFHDDFAYIFNSYYEALGTRHPRAQRGLISRPGLAEITAYRDHVDHVMTEFMATDLDRGVPELITLGLNHEQQHQELLLMDIKHVLSCNPMRPAYQPLGDNERGESVAPPKAGWIEHRGGVAEIGHTGRGFGFDNEFPRHPVYLSPFALADRPVTNGDWMSFMEDDGYRRPEFWLSDGWSVVMSQGWDSPLYWFVDPDQPDRWLEFTLAGVKPVDPNEPVCHVSYYEADAYAHWTGMRLPTEAEWEVIVGSDPTTGNFLESVSPHPRPAISTNAFFGDVWEWTSSDYTPYPGFRTAPGAVGEYNGKFMVSQYVLRGGSCVTPPGHTRATYRNFFPPGARWAFSGVRLARDP